MDIREIGVKLTAAVKKYRWPLLVLLLGVLLMVIPFGNTNENNEPMTTTTEQRLDPQQDLCQILAQIRGVGKVQVLLTVKTGQATKYQTDDDVITSDTGSTVRKETVIVNDSNRNQQALIVQILPPEYLGAVIVCQGADDAQVRLAVMEAVSKATGLGTDKITILKMK